MFETEKFIREVQKKECLWNKNHADYGDSQARRNSWEKIGEIIYDDWTTSGSYEKDEKVLEMCKKWRNVRDYYKKEKKRCEKEMSKPNSSSIKRKRLYNYFDSLTFLDNNSYIVPIDSQDQNATRDFNDNSESSNNEEQIQDEEEEMIQIKKEPSTVNRPLKKPMTQFQKRLLTTLNRSQEDPSHSTSVKNFLQSLIPDVQTLNGQQYMSFRLGVLNLINNIKFGSTEGVNESWVISTMGDNSN